jgi:hypothetical protein
MSPRNIQPQPGAAHGFPGDADYVPAADDSFDDSDWKTAYEDDGRKVVFGPNEPTVQGVFLGIRMVENVTDSRTGELKTLPLYKMRLTNGDPVCFFGSYQLDEAFSNVAEGDEVRVEWKGQDDIGKGQTMNRYRVLTRKPQH